MTVFFFITLRKPLFIRVSEINFLKKNLKSMTYIAKMRKFAQRLIFCYHIEKKEQPNILNKRKQYETDTRDDRHSR